MSISLEKGRTKQLLGALLIWFASAFLLTLLSGLLIGRMKLSSHWIYVAAAVIICLSSFAVSFFLFHRANGGRKFVKALLLWLVIASMLLMLGFLISSDDMNLAGLVRVLTSSLLGTIGGTWIRKSQKKGKRAGRFAKTK